MGAARQILPADAPLSGIRRYFLKGIAMNKFLKVVLFYTLLATLVSAANYAGRLEAREELEKTKKEVDAAREEAKEARAWADIVETEAAELVSRSRDEKRNQTYP